MRTYDRQVGKHTGARDAVPSITSARQALSDDIARRNNRYLWQMSTRFFCFVGAVVVDHWTRWLLVAGAVVLPYIAVVLANAGQERQESTFAPVEAPQLGPGTSGTAPDAALGAGTAPASTEQPRGAP